MPGHSLRIGLLGTELAPLSASAGGLEKLVVGWGRELAKAHDVRLLSFVPASDPFVATRTVTLDSLRREATGLDVLVTNNRLQPAARLSLPTVTVLHNTSEAWDTTSPSRKNGSVLAAVSNFLAGHASQILGLQVATVRPFIDPAFRVSGNESRGNHLLFPNRTLRKKGVEEVLAALEIADSTTVTFVENISPWSTPTAEHAALLAAIKAHPRARLIPRFHQPAELAAAMRTARAVLAPSVAEEGFGLVPLEALATGTPTLISSLGGLAELLPLGAVEVDPQNPAMLAAAMADPVPPPGETPEIIAKHYSRRASAATLERLLQKALA